MRCRNCCGAQPELEGFNVTIPYKREVMRYLDGLSFDARMIGAVNCVRREADGRLTGHNTDIAGLRVTRSMSCWATTCPNRRLCSARAALRRRCNMRWPSAISPMRWFQRDAAKGNYTYDNLPCEVVEQSRLIVNATPVGTYPAADDAPRIPYAYVTPAHCLLDLVYNPPLTQFLAYGQQRGARVMNGGRMFRAQAEAAWEIWNP